jgi:hypothetical protein
MLYELKKKLKNEVRKFEKIPLLEPYEVYPESNPENLVYQNLIWF